MAGTLHGMIDCLLPTVLSSGYPQSENAQGLFTVIYKFLKHLETLGITTEVARHGGLTGTAANVNFWDETSPFLSNAFFVFRFNTNGGRAWPWYLHFQWAGHYGLTARYFGVTPGNPGLANAVQPTASADSFVCSQAAIGVGGDQNPWNGIGTLGTNQKGGRLSGSGGAGPIWTIPSGGTDVLVFPRSNYTGGTHATTKQNYTVHWQSAASNLVNRVHLLADDDNFLLLYDRGDNAAYSLYYYGMYTPLPGLVATYPFAAVDWSATAADIGPIAGGSPGGGVATPSGGVRIVEISRMDLFQDEWTQTPNQFIVPMGSQFDIWKNVLVVAESGHLGTVGEIEFWREVTNTVSFASNSARTKVALGTAAVQDRKLLIPWDGATPPRRNYSVRTGVTF